MVEIDKWAEGKPKEIAILAQQAVYLIKAIYNVIIKIKKNEFHLDKCIENPPVENWISFYDNPQYLIDWLSAKIKNKDQFLSVIGELISNSFENNSNFINKLSLHEIYEINLAEIKTDLNRDWKEKEFSPEEANSFMNPELVFALRVFIPSIFFYSELPSDLLQQARLGNRDALNKILRLDKTVLCDPLINQQFPKLYYHNDYLKFDFLSKALQGNIAGKVSIRKIKTRMAGLISLVSENLGQRLKAPDIEDLFIAFSIDYGPDDPVYDHQPELPDSFSKAVQRERSFWEKVL